MHKQVHNTIYIGTEGQIASAITHPISETLVEVSLSHNLKEYWAHDDLFLGIRLVIGKECREGKNITKLIDQHNVENLSKYIHELVLRKVEIDYFLQMLSLMKERAFVRGVNHLKHELNKLLKE